MKKIIFASFLLLTAATWQAFAPAEEYPTLPIGSLAPLSDYKMKDVSGQQISIEDVKQKNGVLVIFSSNGCPFVIGQGTESEGWEKRYNSIYEASTEAGVGMMLVNSNEGRRGEEDAYDMMQQRAREQGYKSRYVLDENSKLANAFGAKTTPHVFLFDFDLKLIYRGAIDDNARRAADVKSHYLKTALKELSEKKTISRTESHAVGCSIKRVKK